MRVKSIRFHLLNKTTSLHRLIAHQLHLKAGDCVARQSGTFRPSFLHLAAVMTPPVRWGTSKQHSKLALKTPGRELPKATGRS